MWLYGLIPALSLGISRNLLQLLECFQKIQSVLATTIVVDGVKLERSVINSSTGLLFSSCNIVEMDAAPLTLVISPPPPQSFK